MHEIVVVAIAIVIGLIALLTSPVVRVICWDSLLHPRYVCVWVKEGKRFRELKNRVDSSLEG
jgi:hypothetical protein